MSADPVSTTEVELTIRCALQTFEDKALKVPMDWKVQQLKSHLYETCPTKPDPKRQRLIYAGHCLQDNQTLREILTKRCEGLEETENLGPQVIHLVCAPKENPLMASGLRHRPTAANSTNNSNNTTSSSSNSQTNGFNPYQNMNYFSSMPSNILPPNATPEQLAYYANWIGYQQALMTNYYQQMMAGSVPGAQMFPYAGIQSLPGYNVQFNMQPMQPPNPPPQEQPNNVAQPQGINDEEHLNDIVGILYKSIRVGFFLMVLFFYSSVERFFAVFLIMCILWFVHRRREQNHLNEAARRVVQQPPPAPQNPDEDNGPPNENEERPQVNNDNNNNEVPVTVRPGNDQPEAQTRWNLFWSTVSTFFMSLIPDHQVPVEVPE